MIEQYKVEEFLYGNLQKVKRSGGGYVARCPICGDSKKNPNKRRLHVDYYGRYDEWIYTCYNGGCPNPSGNIQSLYAHVMGVTWKEANEELEDKKFKPERLIERLDDKIFEDEVDPTGELDLELKDCLSLSSKPDGRIQEKYLQLLKEFHVNRWIPTRRDIMVAHSGKYKNRFIIPVYENGQMVYFQGRGITDDVQPKYLNPDVIKENIILNINDFDPDKYIIVTEGLIDAFMVEYNQGTACIGASVSDNFLNKLMHKTGKGVIISLDNPDLDESGLVNYMKLLEQSRHKHKLKFFFMNDDRYKDLNDLRIKNKEMNVYEHIVENSEDFFSTYVKITGSFI